MPKRSREANEPSILGSVSQIVDTLVDLEPDDLAKLLAHIANKAYLPNAAFKWARIDLPSFAAAKWATFASKLGMRRLEVWPTTSYHLPSSFHIRVGGPSQRKDRDQVPCVEDKILGLDPILSLFQGRVIDQTDHSIQTKYSTGCDIAHELFLELMSATETNKSNDFAGQRVYGLVTNIEQFQLSMTLLHRSSILTKGRTAAYSDMIAVGNKIFSVILTASVDGLRAIINSLCTAVGTQV